MLFAILMVCVTIVTANVIPFANDNPIEDYPYQVSIERRGSHVCGGAIIDPSHVITAAGCFKELTESKYSVRVGTSHLESSGEVHRTKHIRIHPKYKKNSPDWNVAVMVLETKIAMSSTTAVLQLVPINEEPKEGEVLFLSGWGRFYVTQKDPVGGRLEILNGVSVPSFNRLTCNNAQIPVKVTDTMLCAGGFIVGDLGSPLVNERSELVGVLTWMNNPAEKPAVYVNIANQLVQGFVLSVIYPGNTQTTQRLPQQIHPSK